MARKKKENKKAKYLGRLRIPIPKRGVIPHRPKKGRGSYNRQDSKVKEIHYV